MRLLAAALLSLICWAQAWSAEPLDVAALWALERPGTPIVDASGTLAVVPLTRFDLERNSGLTELWLVHLDRRMPPRMISAPGDSVSGAQFHPQQPIVLFISSRSERPGQVFSLDLRGGEAQRLTELSVPVRRAKWFPDGKRLLLEIGTRPGIGDDLEALAKLIEEQKQDKTQAKVSDNRLFRYWDRWLTDGTVQQLFEYRIEDKALRPLMPEFEQITGFQGFQWDLSPDGTEVAYSANSTSPPYRELRFDIHLLDVASGEIRNLTQDIAGTHTQPTYSPDGRELVWGVRTRIEAGSEFNRPWILDRRSGERAQLSMEIDNPVAGVDFAGGGSLRLLRIQEQGQVNLYTLRRGQRVARRIAEGGSISAPQAAGSRRIVYMRESFSEPGDLYSSRLDGRDERRHSEFNRKALEAIDLGEFESLTYPGSNEVQVQMFVAQPPGFNPERRYPLVILAHGGPFSAWQDAWSYRWHPAMFSAQGYIVAMPNFHGSTGFGQAFADSILGNHGELPAADVLAALDHMIERGNVDPDRVAIAGGSYGGYLVALLIGMTDRFTAAINHAGVYNLSAQFASDATWGRPESYGAAPWTDPEALALWSPSRLAPKVNTPTLILHGEKDYRVPYTQGVNMHGVLSGQGVPSRLVIFPDENHWILRPQAARLWWAEVHGWLEKWFEGAN